METKTNRGTMCGHRTADAAAAAFRRVRWASRRGQPGFEGGIVRRTSAHRREAAAISGSTPFSTGGWHAIPARAS